PQVVNPEHSTQIRNNIRSARNPMEISDRDFANVTSGTSLGRGVQVFNQTRAQKHDNLRGAGGLGITAGAGGAEPAAAPLVSATMSTAVSSRVCVHSRTWGNDHGASSSVDHLFPAVLFACHG